MEKKLIDLNDWKSLNEFNYTKQSKEVLSYMFCNIYYKMTDCHGLPLWIENENRSKSRYIGTSVDQFSDKIEYFDKKDLIDLVKMVRSFGEYHRRYYYSLSILKRDIEEIFHRNGFHSDERSDIWKDSNTEQIRKEIFGE